MVFNSLNFLLFFLLFFCIYWFLGKKSRSAQNLILLIGSYAFYAFADWRFLFLIILTSLVNYGIGIAIHNSANEKKQKYWLWLGATLAILTLGYFKYANFFITSLIDSFALFGIDLHIHTLQMILPLGISFYIFRVLSYILDIYNGRIEPERNLITFFAYVAFFPCLLSGPIDRARTFIPQLNQTRIFNFNQATEGLKLILWGLFKKIVIADNCAQITNLVFDNYQSLPTDTLLLGALYYTIQIYADFSGYSDMAIGLGRLLGLQVTRNFNYPYFSQNIAHYWRNWHISLTSWLTEYIFTPLSIQFRDWGKLGLICAILINFIIVGLWHGANWTFVLFGFLHGCYFIPLILRNKMNKRIKPLKVGEKPSLSVIFSILATLLLVIFTNIVFRSESVNDAVLYFAHLLTLVPLSVNDSLLFFHAIDLWGIKELFVFCLIVLFFILEWKGKETECPLFALVTSRKRFVRWLMYYSIVSIICFFAGNEQEFIYFQF